MTEILIDGISKRYDPGLFKKKVQAVREMSLEVHKGEIFGLIGPNGAGKSTTIRLMLGLIRPDAGRILFRDQPLRQSNIRQKIGYLPENPYLYDHLTLEEILSFSGKASGLNPGDINKRSRTLLEKVDLFPARKRALRTFSKGMLQRAGLCFALLHDPDVVILDEPMSGLDPLGRKMMFDFVKELGEAGKTVFFCSHILSDVERLCDRIGLLVRGRLVRVFSKESFREDSENPIYLVVEPMTPEEKYRLSPLVGEIADEGATCVISIGQDSLLTLLSELTRMNKKVLGTRGERISLERLFVDAVEENAA